MTDKHILNSARLRNIPRGFGWIDHRWFRSGRFDHATADALALYLLLICAADGDGLSFYGDTRLCKILHFTQGRLDAARQVLIDLGAIAWEAPLYQVLEYEDDPMR